MHAGRVLHHRKFAIHSRDFSRNFARFRTPKSRNLGDKCSANSATNFADIRRVAQRTRCTLAEFCMGGKLKSNKICHAFARFLAKFSMRTFERRSRAISVTNAALTRQQLSLTSGVLRNACGARRPSLAVRRTQTKFAMHSRVFSRNFARFRTPKSRSLGN